MFTHCIPLRERGMDSIRIMAMTSPSALVQRYLIFPALVTCRTSFSFPYPQTRTRQSLLFQKSPSTRPIQSLFPLVGMDRSSRRSPSLTLFFPPPAFMLVPITPPVYWMFFFANLKRLESKEKERQDQICKIACKKQ